MWRVILEVAELRDSIYYAQLARKARQLASTHSDPLVARHLRESAVKHDRRARQLARTEGASKGTKRGLGKILARFRGFQGGVDN